MEHSGRGLAGKEGQERKVRTVEDVTMGEGALDFYDSDGVISGNIYRGGVVRGLGDVTVQGMVSGEPNSLSTIDIRGIFVAECSVAGAKISARHAVVKEDVAHSTIRSELGAEVGGDLSETLVTLGQRSGEIQTLRQYRVDAQRIKQALDELKIRIGLAARRFVRDYPEVELQLGGILTPTRRELRVDLRPFYQAVENQSPENVERALEEFYLRVMVGMLTRANRSYVSRNPSRHKVFLKLIEELRRHILAVRESDMLQERTKELKGMREELLRELVKPMRCELRVGGEVGNNVTVQMLQFRGFHEKVEGTVEMDEAWATAKTVETEEGRRLDVTNLVGETKTTPIEENGMRNGTFALEDGTMVWRSAR